MTIRRRIPKFDPEKFDPVPEAVDSKFVDPHSIDGNLIMEEGDYGDDHNDNPTDPLDELREEDAPRPASGLGVLNDVILLRTGQLVGRRQTVPPELDPSNPKPVELMTLKASDELNSMLSVTIGQSVGNFTKSLSGATVFAPNPPNPRAIGATDFENTYAVIQWGAGAAQFETTVDLIPGQVFTVGGSFLRIMIVNRARDGAGNLISAEFQAFVSLLPKGSQRHPAYRSFGYGAKTAGLPVKILIPLPLFTKSIRYYRNPETVPYQIAVNGIATILTETVAANEHPPEVVIPGGGVEAFVILGADQLAGSIVCELDL